MFDVAIVRSDNALAQVHLVKLCASLSKKYRVLLLCWNRDGNFPSFEYLERGLTVYRFRMICPSGRVYRRIVPTLLFSFWVLRTLLSNRPKVAHACDVDVAIPCFIYKLITGTYFVFDVRDRFSLIVTDKVLRTILKSLEDFFVSKADLFITNSMALFDSFIHRPQNSLMIMNCPEDKKPTRSDTRISSVFRIVYAGYITPTRGLRLLVEAISNLENVELIIAGKSESHEYLKTLTSYENVSYLGILSINKANELQSTADLIVIPYDPTLPMNRIGMPNKLFDAMMLGIPVVSTVGREIIEETSCGIFVKYDLDSMKSAIRYLKENPGLRHKMGVNGRIAFEAKYNWDAMEKKLMTAYERLFRQAANQELQMQVT